MNEVATINQAAASLKDKVTERIRSQFVDLIPEDTWKGLVEQEIEWFTKKAERQYNQREWISPLQQEIREVLRALVDEAIKKALQDTEWLQKYGPDGSLLAGEAVIKLIKENAVEVVAQVFGSAVQGAVDNMRRY